MSITVNLPPDIETQLKDKAARDGQALEDYVRALLITKTNDTEAVSFRLPLSSHEFERLLDELSEPAPVPGLPADFSRADVYTDHD